MAQKADRSNTLSFRYPTAAIAGLGSLALLIAMLAWYNDRRAESELRRATAQLCTSEGLASPDALGDDANPGSWKAWAIVEGLLRGVVDDGRWDTRILQQGSTGWKEWHRWSTEPVTLYDTRLDEAFRAGKCAGSLENGTLRIMRPLHTHLGVPTLIVIERARQ